MKNFLESITGKVLRKGTVPLGAKSSEYMNRLGMYEES